MEHKSRKMFAAIVVIMLCAVAIIGVGYAYTASTKNDSNTVQAEYVMLDQDGNGKYTFATDGHNKVYWNTTDYYVNSSTANTDFKLDGATTVAVGDTTNNYQLVQIGESFTVRATQVGGTISESLTCAVSTNMVHSAIAGVEIFLKITSTKAASTPVFMKLVDDDTDSFKTWNSTAWSGPAKFSIENNGSSGYYESTVEVYYGYAGATSEAAVTVTHVPGTAVNNGPEQTPIDGKNLVFTVTVDTTSTP